MTWAEQCFALLPTHHPAATLLTLIQTYPNWDISHSNQMCDNQSGDDRLAKTTIQRICDRNIHTIALRSQTNIPSFRQSTQHLASSRHVYPQPQPHTGVPPPSRLHGHPSPRETELYTEFTDWTWRRPTCRSVCSEEYRMA